MTNRDNEVDDATLVSSEDAMNQTQTGGLFLIGYLYDYWTLNAQIDQVNASQPGAA